MNNVLGKQLVNCFGSSILIEHVICNSSIETNDSSHAYSHTYICRERGGGERVEDTEGVRNSCDRSAERLVRETRLSSTFQKILLEFSSLTGGFTLTATHIFSICFSLSLWFDHVKSLGFQKRKSDRARRRAILGVWFLKMFVYENTTHSAHISLSKTRLWALAMEWASPLLIEWAHIKMGQIKLSYSARNQYPT